MIDNLVSRSKFELSYIYDTIDENAYYNSKKVLDAFQKNKLSESDFNGTTGYGYNDIGRDKIEHIYADIFKCEDALVRNQFISGTHALTVALFGILRPGDVMLSISGKPYDTLDEIIGIKSNDSSLASYNINYEQIDLKDDDFDYDAIAKRVREGNIKLIAIQRSKGYTNRKSISIEKIEKVIKLIKDIDKNICIMVDNCYCEFVTLKEPTEVGADLCIGSLIKNLGGGIASNGAYIVGKKEYIKLCSERLNMPSEGKEVGPSLGASKSILQGLYFAPSVVASSLKTAVFASFILEHLGYTVEPRFDEYRADIVQTITFDDKDKLIRFVEGIQMGSAVDSFALPTPSSMPGYSDKIIMASGSFTQGSSIELSCDGPIRKPYVAYLQGSLTFDYGRLGIIKAAKHLSNENN